MDGIYVKLFGGLGNQLFEMAAGYVVSRKYNRPLYYSSETHTNHHGNCVNYTTTIFENIGTSLVPMIYPDHRFPTTVSTEAYSNDHLKFPITFDQHFQYYPPLEPYEQELRALFKARLTKYVIEFPELENSAFLHVRRGDYLTLPHIHPTTPLSYYETAIHALKDRVSLFYIFSDDIQWVQQQALFQSDKMVCIHSNDELYTLAFMSKCRGGSICANSTFAWWGAFLGAHEKRNPVFVPRDWIRLQRIDGLFPSEWTVL